MTGQGEALPHHAGGRKGKGLRPAILIGCLAALASPCELGLDVGRRF